MIKIKKENNNTPRVFKKRGTKLSLNRPNSNHRNLLVQSFIISHSRIPFYLSIPGVIHVAENAYRGLIGRMYYYAGTFR